MTSGHIGQLHVIDARQMALDRLRDVLAHHVHVVDVELEEEIFGPDAADDVDRLFGAGKKEAGHVTGVDGFDEQPDAGGIEFRGRVSKVPDHRLGRRGSIQARRPDPSQAVDPRAAERRRVLYRPLDACFELGDSIGQAGDAALAGRPVARREVVEHLFKAARRQPLLEEALVVAVGKQIFDPLEPAPGRRLESVQELEFIEQHRQIRGEFWHMQARSQQRSYAVAAL